MPPPCTAGVFRDCRRPGLRQTQPIQADKRPLSPTRWERKHFTGSLMRALQRRTTALLGPRRMPEGSRSPPVPRPSSRATVKRRQDRLKRSARGVDVWRWRCEWRFMGHLKHLTFQIHNSSSQRIGSQHTHGPRRLISFPSTWRSQRERASSGSRKKAERLNPSAQHWPDRQGHGGGGIQGQPRHLDGAERSLI